MHPLHPRRWGSHRGRLLSCGALGLNLALIPGCTADLGEEHASEAPPVTVELAVSPERIYVDRTPARATVTAMNRVMCVVPGSASLESSDESVAVVDDETGQVRGVAAGRALIRARRSGAADSAWIEVADPYRTPTGAMSVEATPEGRVRFTASLVPSPAGSLSPLQPVLAGPVTLTVDGVTVLEGRDENRPGAESLVRSFESWSAAGRALGLEMAPGTTHTLAFRSEAEGFYLANTFERPFTVPAPPGPFRWLRSSPDPEHR